MSSITESATKRSWKVRIKEKLSIYQRIRLLKLRNYLLGLMKGNDLKALAYLNYCDKILDHNYIRWYIEHFQTIRNKKLRILEIGIGGNQDKFHGGASLRMWRSYFPNSRIIGLDLHDKSIFEESRIKIYQGSQDDEKLLTRIHDEQGPFDIIIDDGSHQNHHVLKSFSVLFPLLKDEGIYVVEDTQTSYWPEFGGENMKLPSEKTSMGYFRSLIDGLNHDEFLGEDYSPTYLDENILGISFYHNIIFITKGNNKEGSNLVKRRK